MAGLCLPPNRGEGPLGPRPGLTCGGGLGLPRDPEVFFFLYRKNPSGSLPRGFGPEGCIYLFPGWV